MKKNVAEAVREAVLPEVEKLGYRLCDVEYKQIGADFHLEITIDSDTGISIDDCERVHRAVEPTIDALDPVEGFYYLEVSSPGTEREIKTEQHVQLCLGKEAEARLFTPRDGKRSFRGTLLGTSENNEIILLCDGQELRLPKDSVAKLSLVSEL